MATEIASYLHAVIDGTTAGSNADQAINHLAVRSVADAEVGQRVILLGRPIQMFSVVRSILESLNLMRLFEKQPELATEWMQGGNNPKFKPWAVRSTLGLPTTDEFYSTMCEYSHPRLMGYLWTQDWGRERDVLMLDMNGIPLEDERVVLCLPVPLQLLTMIAEHLDTCARDDQSRVLAATAHARVTALFLEAVKEMSPLVNSLLPGSGAAALYQGIADNSQQSLADVDEIQHLVDAFTRLEAGVPIGEVLDALPDAVAQALREQLDDVN